MVICVSSWLDILKLGHLKQFLIADLDVGFIEVLLGNMALRHGRGTSVAASVGEGQGLSGFLQNLILLSYHLLGVFSVVVRYHISDWGTWSIGAPVGVRFLWEEHWLLWDFLHETGKVL